MDCPKILNRYGKPGRYDMVPYGTLCKVSSGDSGEFEVYRQISEDENVPLWELQEGLMVQRLHLVVTACDALTERR